MKTFSISQMATSCKSVARSIKSGIARTDKVCFWTGVLAFGLLFMLIGGMIAPYSLWAAYFMLFAGLLAFVVSLLCVLYDLVTDFLSLKNK